MGNNTLSWLWQIPGVLFQPLVSSLDLKSVLILFYLPVKFLFIRCLCFSYRFLCSQLHYAIVPTLLCIWCFITRVCLFFHCWLLLHFDVPSHWLYRKKNTEKTTWTFPVQLLGGGTHNPRAYINLSLNTFYFLCVLSLPSFIMLNFTLHLLSQLCSAKI